MLLAGDIGGTKTVLAVFAPQHGLRAPLAEATFRSAEYASLAAIVEQFLAQSGLAVEQACFGVAGPVVNGRAVATNLPWLIAADELRSAFGFAAASLLNDLEATAYAVPSLTPADYVTLNSGSTQAGGTIAVIAPGTGLGEAFLTTDGGRYYAHASEGGHTDWAPNGLLEIELLRFLHQRYGHVSYERVCSGRGLPNIYAFLKESGYAEESAVVAEQLAGAPDPVPIIVESALRDAPCPLCVATLATFVSILAAEAGNLALKMLATGGVYLGGGMPPRILPALQQPGFLDAFCNKGRFADLLATIPVHVILHPRTALLGAACYGLSRYSAA